MLGGLSGLPEIARRLRDGEAGPLELSFVSTADYSVLPELVRQYASLYPSVRIALREATSEVQIAALLEGSGHAGIVIPPANGALPAPLRYRRLLSEQLVAAVPEGWVDDGRLPLQADRLNPAVTVQAPLIIFPRHSAPAFHDLITGYFTAHGGTARIVQEAIQMQTIISLVSAEMGIALVPASLRNLARTGVRYIDLAGAVPSLETGIVWRRDDLTPTLNRFLQVAFGGQHGA
ncbi:LysR substrate-binding domain-containing protein [Pseudoroseomonas wenyumeiae]